MLAINRCVEIGFPSWSEYLFRGVRTWLWMLIPALYALYVFMFEKAPSFTSLFFAFFFNPHVGYISDFSEFEKKVKLSKISTTKLSYSSGIINSSVLRLETALIPQLDDCNYFARNLHNFCNDFCLSHWSSKIFRTKTQQWRNNRFPSSNCWRMFYSAKQTSHKVFS